MESDADALVSGFWNRLGAWIPPVDAKPLGQFRNPSADQPVRVAEFLRHAELGFIEPFLRSVYKDPEAVTFAPLAMFRAVAYKHLKRIVGWDKLALTLREHSQDALDLGFAIVDGEPMIPDGEWFRRWSTHYLSNLRWEGVMDRLVEALRDALAKLDAVPLGKFVTHDATPVKARGRDAEATYNDHYKITGFKADLLVDRHYGLPLVERTTLITQSDGDNLIPAWERANDLGLRIEDARVDGGYTSFRNFAHAAVHQVRVKSKITESWVYHPEATVEGLERKYATYWRHENFTPKPKFQRMIRLLLERGEDELVGAWYRNALLAEHAEAPVEYQEAYNERNTSESVNGHMKNDLDLAWTWRGKGMRSFDQHATECCVTLLLVALTRAQHAITTSLSSLRGLV